VIAKIANCDRQSATDTVLHHRRPRRPDLPIAGYGAADNHRVHDRIPLRRRFFEGVIGTKDFHLAAQSGRAGEADVCGQQRDVQVFR
jgi:hypothetical protein